MKSDFTAKKAVGILILITAIILVCVFVGTVLIWTVYHIPTWEMDSALYSSAQTIQKEGTYPVLFDWSTSQLDNFTDAYMMSIAGHRSEERNIIQTMRIPVPQYINPATPDQRLISHYIDNVPYELNDEYSRYWHGYLLYLKPLLCFLDYNDIRYVNSALHILVFFFVLYLMDLRGLKKYIPAFFVSYLFLCPPAIMSSLQFSSCYYMMMLGSIALLSLRDDQYISYAPYVFLFIGIGTVFFDLLTYPAITLGVPAVLYYCRRKTATIKTATIEGCNICFFWGFGYAGMWMSKWILASLILKEDIIADAAKTIAFRSSLDAEQQGNLLQNVYNALIRNVHVFSHSPAYILAIALFLVLVIIMLRRVRTRSQ